MCEGLKPCCLLNKQNPQLMLSVNPPHLQRNLNIMSEELNVRLKFVAFLGSIIAFTGQLRAAMQSTVVNKCFSSLCVKMRSSAKLPSSALSHTSAKDIVVRDHAVHKDTSKCTILCSVEHFTKA